jgi:hypothetical protein
MLYFPFLMARLPLPYLVTSLQAPVLPWAQVTPDSTNKMLSSLVIDLKQSNLPLMLILLLSDQYSIDTITSLHGHVSLSPSVEKVVVVCLVCSFS